MRDENDLEKCVACGLCSVACPADAIYLEARKTRGAFRRARATRRCTRFTRRAVSSAATVKRRVRSAPFSWARITSWRSTARISSSGTRRTSSSRPPAPKPPDRGRAIPARPARPAWNRQPTTIMMIGALGDIHGEFDTVQEIMRGTPTCRSGCRWATSPATTASTSRRRAPLLDQGQQRGLRRRRRSGSRPFARADAALPAQRRAPSGRATGAWRRSEARLPRAGITRRPRRCRRREDKRRRPRS